MRKWVMLRLLMLLMTLATGLLRSRRDLVLENLALRQQLAALTFKHSRPRLTGTDRIFWILLRRFWTGWKDALVFVQPGTVIRWHRAGFELYWKWISRKHAVVGRKPTSQALRELIFRIVAENRTWGAPRIHGELKMLGFDISERTVLRWMRKAPRSSEPARRWATFLSNHREAIAAMDFFTVPTLAFGVLYCFFVIAHDRRRILHYNVTRHPTQAWLSQQLREAFPYDSAPKFLILDREHTFQGEVLETAQSLGVTPIRIAVRSPWQNGVAERFVGNCRRDLLDHVIALNDRHLKRLMSEYVHYYHDDRTHPGLDKETPATRTATARANANSKVIATSRMGGLQHRYDLAA